MNRLFLLITVVVIIAVSDAFGQKKSRSVKVTPDSISTDSVEYELIITDIGFESWLATRPSINFYSQSYYEMKNRDYVIVWNHRADNPGMYRGDYGTRIDYNPGIDYGLELNYRLYNYFLFFEEKNKVKLLNTSR